MYEEVLKSALLGQIPHRKTTVSRNPRLYEWTRRPRTEYTGALAVTYFTGNFIDKITFVEPYTLQGTQDKTLEALCSVMNVND